MLQGMSTGRWAENGLKLHQKHLSLCFGTSFVAKYVYLRNFVLVWREDVALPLALGRSVWLIFRELITF